MERLITVDFIRAPVLAPLPQSPFKVIPPYVEVIDYRHLMRIFVKFSRTFVISDTAKFLATRTLLQHSEGVVMNSDKKDVATLIELLKMAAERRTHLKLDQISQNERFSEDISLLEMWPEACRRTGAGTRAFPPGVIEIWKQSLGRAN